MTKLVDLISVILWAASGLVIGFCLGGLLGPRLWGSGEGFQDLGYMFNGAIFGAGLGLVGGVLTWIRQPLVVRRKLVAFVVAAAVGQALLTWFLVRSFDAW